MKITQQEATDALDAITTADQRVREHQGYREGSPFLILWGVLWFVGNLATALVPRVAGTLWLALIVLGTIGTVALVVAQSRRAQRVHDYTPAERAAIGRRASLLGLSVMTFFPAMYLVLGEMTPVQNNAFISLSWALVYMAGGAWLGLRLFVTGVATAVAVLVGVLLLREHYFLWMAFAGGGSLLLGGLWLRKL
jgi:hypothetical protein